MNGFNMWLFFCNLYTLTHLQSINKYKATEVTSQKQNRNNKKKQEWISVAFIRKSIEEIQYVCGVLRNTGELEMEHRELCMLVFIGMRLNSICGIGFSLSF